MIHINQSNNQISQAKNGSTFAVSSAALFSCCQDYVILVIFHRVFLCLASSQGLYGRWWVFVLF